MRYSPSSSPRHVRPIRAAWPHALAAWLGLAAIAMAAKFSTVVIDAGHGGKDKGAFWGGVRESHLALSVAQHLEGMLKKKGVRTVMTRRSDAFISIPRRAAIANSHRHAVLVSIHFNAHTNTRVRGTETFHWGPAGKVLATAIQRRLVARLGTVNRGVQRKGFSLLVQSRHPAVLVECGFISNPAERARCVTRSFQVTAAQAICDGLMAYRSTR